MMTMYPTIPTKRVDPDAELPRYAHDGDAGMDLCSTETVAIRPHETVMVGSGVAMAIPRGFYGAIVPRSGMSTKRGVTLANSPSTIDSGYRGEIMLPLHNIGNRTVTVEAGERVCQIIIKPHATAQVVEVDELDETERGEGGFGSTGERWGRL